ncbi:MAG: TM1266 family iron-only hydrogenase system putative regulator [Candidatus Limimorpha sp.]
MEKRLGTVIIEISNREAAPRVNDVISRHSGVIIGRLGIPRANGTSIISLILEGTTDEIGALTGQLGRLSEIEVKSALLKSKGNEN